MTPAVTGGPTLAARAEALLAQHWWQPQPSAMAQLLRPWSWLYRALAGWQRRRQRPQALPVPVIVVGNFIVGGAGKTPTVIALVQALSAAGWHPGVISRGYGRRDAGAREVAARDPVVDVGDEPLLIRRRTAVPVWVGRDRVAAARALCARHPEVDVIVSDDGLQHHALPRRAEWVVFDERGAGNGLLLPAGPLREPLPKSLPALAHLRGRPLLAAAGLAAPEKFFAMLEQVGLTITRLPLPDHHDYATLPWPADTAEVVTTEKDAVKIDPAHIGATQVWVVPLDLALPASLVGELMSWLPAPTPP